MWPLPTKGSFHISDEKKKSNREESYCKAATQRGIRVLKKPLFNFLPVSSSIHIGSVNAQGLQALGRQQRKSIMPTGKKSQRIRRNRRTAKSSKMSFPSEYTRSYSPAFNAERMGVPTALASWIGQWLASLLRGRRRKER